MELRCRMPLSIDAEMPSSNGITGDGPPSDGGGPEDLQTTETWMDPSVIKFTQCSISEVFTKKLLQSRKTDDPAIRSGGTYAAALKAAPTQTLVETLLQLKTGTITVQDIPTIRVCQLDGQFYSLDNRRLWVFKKYGKPIPVLIEEPSKEFYQKLTKEGDGNSVQFFDPRDKEAERDSDSFLGIVLKWSVEDIMNERMYVNKVQQIPLRFRNVQAYYKAFHFPALEDARSQLQQSLEAIGLAPYISLHSVDDRGRPDRKKTHLRILRLSTLRGKHFVERNTNNAPWKPKPTDVVMLSTVIMEDSQDFRRTGEHYTLAELRATDDSDKADYIFFDVVAYLPEEGPECKEILDGERSWYAIFLGNVSTAMRIWDALHPDPKLFELDRMRTCDGPNESDDCLDNPWELVEETLYSEDTQEARSTSDNDHDVDLGLETVVEKYCNMRHLNESQTEAVRCTVMGLVNRKGFRVRLIQGPPGTGKTSTVVALLSIVSCLTARTLVCAPTNRALSEVAQRFLQHLQSSLLEASQFSDFTSPAAIGMRFCRPLQMGDIVMVGNEERLDTDTILGEVFLPRRVRRLLQALAPLSGWRHTSQLVVNFLKDAGNEYEMYVELWTENTRLGALPKAQQETSANETEETHPLGFLQFLRKELGLMGSSMIDNGRIMCNDVSSKRLSNGARTNIEHSCLLLENLIKKLADEILTDAPVRDCFTGICSPANNCLKFCSDREKIIHFMSTQPGFSLMGYGLVPVANQVEEQCMKDACLVFSTTASAGRRCVKGSGPFQYAVIDEAAQLVEAETAIVTQVPGIERALLVGDPRQLQALVTSKIVEGCGYGRSLFERLQTLGHPCHMLNVQYRMHPAISLFPNARFYNGAVKDGPNVLARPNKSYQDMFGPYAFIDVRDGIEERGDKGTSWRNPVEAEVVLHLIHRIAAETSESLDVGVIAPYKSQVELIMKRRKRGTMIEVNVNTVDGFQGGEKDVILFSAVRANTGGHIGFVDNARRLNVALTRGRYCVWIIGNAKTLAAQDDMWGTLIADAQKRNCYRSAGDDQGIKKAIIRVKKELEQFASLLQHDSVLFQDTLWKIIFSKEFKDTITKIKSVHDRQIILNALLHIANGRRSPYPTKCTFAAEQYHKMIHVQPSAGLSLVWSIDVERIDPARQVIRIWNVLESQYVPGLIRRLEAAFSTYTGPYIERCSTLNFLNKSSKLVTPAVWKRDVTFKWHEASRIVRKAAGALSQLDEAGHLESQLEKATVDESILLMKFYSLTSGIARQLLTAGNGSNIELPFVVNEEEAAIIQYPFSMFIVGRSGTGKTTVITTRLLKLEQQYRLAVNGLANKSGEDDGRVITSQASTNVSGSSETDYLRQVLVTLSPKLCAAIKHHIAKTSRTMLAEDSNTTIDNNDVEEDVMLDEDEELKLMGGIPDSLVNISPRSFPLVITFRKFLAMVDGSVSRPFFEHDDRQLHSSPLGKPRFEESEIPLSDAEEEHESNSLSELDEEGKEELNYRGKDEDEVSDDFSLDEDLATGDEDTVIETFGGKKSKISGTSKRTKTEVTFEHFVSFYWPHFNQGLVRQFDSSVVFTEIISFIKGCLEALYTPNGRLTREQYLSLAVKRTSTFSEQQRESIYIIFQLYERRKAVRREYDIADYCRHLYGQCRLGNYVGLKFHYVYVDEVQDLTMAQIALFKYVCTNREEGYVFAGDTAQTIARGVSFRFQDIRHLFYTEFLDRLDSSLNWSHETSQMACVDQSSGNHEKPLDQRSSKRGKIAAEKTPHMADLHHLNHNFRTHVGIVNIANSIVELLYRFFPNAVDRLDPESSLIQGERPIFLEREDNHEFVTSLFGHGGAAGGGGCDFGAEQVILVRDLATKHHITEKLGKGGLVMSVLECKGLEFQDVLLYNFFSDSPFGRNWRVIYSYMAENCTLEDQTERSMHFPHFDAQKHNLLMSELKQLYVVVTRARQRLWIYDDGSDHHKPMLDFWNRSGLIQVKRLDEDLIQTIHGKSTPEDWKRRGIQMFNDHIYDMAQLSFERAGDLHRANWAKAAGLQQAGERLLGSDTKASAQLFREAATLFMSLGKGESAAKCYLKIGENKKAGVIYRDSFNPPRFEDAGDCFMDAKCWNEAAEAYSKSMCFRRCLLACLKGKLLDLGASFLDEWQHILNDRIEEGRENTIVEPFVGDEFEQLKVDYLRKCALHFHKHRNTTAMMMFVRRFPSVTSRKVFLKRRDYFDQLIEVEEGEGNFLRAAEMAEQKGDLKHAVLLLVRGGCHAEAVGKLIRRAGFEMLWSDGKLGWPLTATAESEDLLQRVRGIVSCSPDDIHSDLLQELELLVGSKSGLQHWEGLKDSSNIRLQLITGRQAIDELQVGSTATNTSLSDFVHDLLQIWDIWSQKVISLIQAIDRALRRRDTVEDEVYLHNSNTYLGVEKHAQPHLFFVTDVTASWLANCRITRLPNQGSRGQVSSSELFSLSETFWATQLWQVGLGVMKALEAMVFNRSNICLPFAEARSFSTADCQPRGELLCKLYSITEVLAGIMSKNSIQDGYQDLRNRLQRYGGLIYDASFPHQCSDESWSNVLTFRLEVGTIYDSIATNLLDQVSQPALHRLSCETLGRIQMLFPLLSRQWIRKYGPEIQTTLGTGDWSNMWEKTVRMYSKPTEDSWESPENVCANWVVTSEIYCRSLKNVYSGDKNTIGPFVFMQLLERGIVVDLACHTNLHSLILPQSLVRNHMIGDLNSNLYSAILNVPCGCKGNCFRFSTLRVVSRLILDILNYSNYQLETWFDKAQIDWREHLPSLIFRMLVSVLTICINLKFTAKSNDRDIWDRAITTLKTVFRNQSPLLRGLHQQFSRELTKTFTSLIYPQDDDIRLTFKRAMAATNDPLIVLKHRGYGKKIAYWAHRNKVRYMIVTSRLENRRVFRFDLESNKAPARVVKAPVRTDGAILNTDLAKLVPVELHSSVKTENVDSHALDIIDTLLSTGPVVAPSGDIDGPDELPVDEVDQPQDAWVEDEPDSRTFPPGHVSIGEGQTVANSIKSVLLQLLEAARQRLKEELSATEKHRRDTRTTFWKRNVQRKEYVEFFLSEACSLKATADEWLQELETALQALKDDDSFDEIADYQDALAKAVIILDPRTEEHKTQDLEFLKAKLTEVRELLETGKEKYQKKIRMPGIGCKDTQVKGENMSSGTVEGEIDTSAHQKMVTKSQKSKSQQKKKRKGKR